MTREEFYTAYASRSRISVDELRDLGRVAVACSCDEEGCAGWQMVAKTGSPSPELVQKYLTLLQTEIDSELGPDIQHGNADDMLCDLLCELGYGEIVAVYEKMERWFS